MTTRTAWGILVVLATVEVAARSGAISPLVAPAPSSVVASGWRNADLLAAATLRTVVYAGVGLGIGAVAGILAAGASIFLRSTRQAGFLFAGYEALPKLAIAPLFLVWFGTGPSLLIALAASMCIYPFVIFSKDLINIRRHPAYEAATVLNPGKLRLLRWVVVPLMAPATGKALSLAVPAALVGSVVGEFVSSANGLGHMLQSATSALNTPLAFACLLILLILGGIGPVVFGDLRLER